MAVWLIYPLSARGAEQSSDQIVVVEQGIYVAEKHEAVLAPGTAVGSVHTIGKANFTELTSHVCARIGEQFGLRIQPGDAASHRPEAIRVLVEHPSMHMPDGRDVTREQWDSMLSDRGSVIGFSFDSDYELLPGTWAISFAVDGIVVVRREFSIRVDCSNPVS